LFEWDFELHCRLDAAGLSLLQDEGSELQSGISLFLNLEFGTDLDDVIFGLDDVVNIFIRLQDIKDTLLVFGELRCVEKNASSNWLFFLSLALAFLLTTSGCSFMSESDVRLAITQVFQENCEAFFLLTSGGPSLVNQELSRLFGQILALLKSWHQD
jgi:hypothetical protein